MAFTINMPNRPRMFAFEPHEDPNTVLENNKAFNNFAEREPVNERTRIKRYINRVSENNRDELADNMIRAAEKF